MTFFKDRTKVVVLEKNNRDAIEILKPDSEIAIVAVCDTHISSRESRGTFVEIRHNYYVYHVPYWGEELKYKDCFEQAISTLLHLQGIIVRAIESDINIVRVQVTFGDNLVQPEMATLISQKVLELRKK